jgi:hypothetical protein
VLTDERYLIHAAVLAPHRHITLARRIAPAVSYAVFVILVDWRYDERE